MGKERTTSMEDYLEAISMLAERGKAVRVTQISQALGVKKPSVTAALKRLKEAGLAQHERYGYVELTTEGERIAEEVFRRHEALRRFMTEILGVASEIAVEDACRMEHSLSPASLERLTKFVEFVLTYRKPKWLKEFDSYFKHAKHSEEG